MDIHDVEVQKVNGSIRSLLEAEDLEKIILGLIDYTKRRTRMTRNKVFLDGRTIEDIVFDVIQKVLSGKRAWAPRKNPDIRAFLRSVVKSEISHLWKSKDHTCLERLSDGEKESEHLDEMEGTEPSPEKLVLAFMEDKELQDRILQLVDGDEELESVVLAVMETHALWPKEISEITGLPMWKVYKLRDRLRELLADKLVS